MIFFFLIVKQFETLPPKSRCDFISESFAFKWYISTVLTNKILLLLLWLALLVNLTEPNKYIANAKFLSRLGGNIFTSQTV